MEKQHVSVPAGSCLITELTSTLSRATGSLADLHVVLPTQRLHLYLSRELARKQNNACVLPRLWTWDQFAQDVIGNYYDNNLVMVSSQCELIMEYILKKRGSSETRESPLNTNSRHAHELLHLHSELSKSGAASGAKQRLIEYLERDWRRSEDVFTAVSRRVHDVFSALDDFDDAMSQMSWVTEAHSRASAVGKWLDAESEFQQSSCPRGPVIIAGLTSLPPLEVKLLSRISKHQNISIWLDEPPPHAENSPLAELRAAIGLTPATASEKSWARGVKSIASAPDITHEVAHSLTRAKELVSQGVSPHEIAIIVPDEGVHGPAYTALCEALNIDVNIPLATPWTTTLPARWFNLATQIGSGYDIHTLGQYLLHPMTRKIFDAPGDFDEHRLQMRLKDVPETERDPSPI